MNLIFAVNLARRYSDILESEGVHKRLFSYFLLRGTTAEFLPYYVTYGRMPRTNRHKKRVVCEYLEAICDVEPDYHDYRPGRIV